MRMQRQKGDMGLDSGTIGVFVEGDLFPITAGRHWRPIDDAEIAGKIGLPCRE